MGDKAEHCSVIGNLQEDNTWIDFGEEMIFVTDQRGFETILNPLLDEIIQLKSKNKEEKEHDGPIQAVGEIDG